MRLKATLEDNFAKNCIKSARTNQIPARRSPDLPQSLSNEIANSNKWAAERQWERRDVGVRSVYAYKSTILNEFWMSSIS